MKTTLMVTLIVAASLSAPVDEAHAGTGNELLRDCSLAVRDADDLKMGEFQAAAFCSGFLRGFASANAGYIVLERTDRPLFCTPDDVTVNQLVRVVHKYLEEHPQDLHKSDGPLTLSALSAAFPCKP